MTITVDVVEATKHVQLHSRELGYQSAVFIQGGKTQEVEHINFNFKKQIVDFVFENDLTVGEGQLVVEYSGILNNQMAGFYRSTYNDLSGKEKVRIVSLHQPCFDFRVRSCSSFSQVMASTQFESLDARRAFPCWDEVSHHHCQVHSNRFLTTLCFQQPAAKAVFELTLIIDSQLSALSNMPEASIKSLSNNKKEVHFLPSVKMSTYLLAFVVGEFDFVAVRTCFQLLSADCCWRTVVGG